MKCIIVLNPISDRKYLYFLNKKGQITFNFLNCIFQTKKEASLLINQYKFYTENKTFLTIIPFKKNERFFRENTLKKFLEGSLNSFRPVFVIENNLSQKGIQLFAVLKSPFFEKINYLIGNNEQMLIDVSQFLEKQIIRIYNKSIFVDFIDRLKDVNMSLNALFLKQNVDFVLTKKEVFDIILNIAISDKKEKQNSLNVTPPLYVLGDGKYQKEYDFLILNVSEKQRELFDKSTLFYSLFIKNSRFKDEEFDFIVNELEFLKRNKYFSKQHLLSNKESVEEFFSCIIYHLYENNKGLFDI